MGEIFSRFFLINQLQQAEPDPVPLVFSKQPWVKIKDWGKSKRDALYSEVRALRPDTSLNVKSFNIILMGEIGSGKSSFFNSINSILKNVVIPNKAPVGRIGHSLTKEFMMYELGKRIPIRIGDTMGVQNNSSAADIKNILSVVDGHVPVGHVFILHEEFTCNNPRYIERPTIADKGHCVAIVINANDCYNMADNMKKKLQSLAEGLISRKVTYIVLLTHLDIKYPELQKDITKTFHHISLKNTVSKISSMLHGLSKNLIFPVINYQQEFDLDHNTDILLLYPLRAMVNSAQAYLENFEKLAERSSNSNSLPYGQQEMGPIESNEPVENEMSAREL